MKQIWKRIFIYTVVLLMFMQFATLMLHRYTLDGDEFRHYVAENMQGTAATLTGADMAGVKVASSLFGRRGGRIWVMTAERDGQEVVLAGNPDFKLDKALERFNGPRWEMGNLTMWGTKDEKDRLLAAIPVQLGEAETTLYVSYGRGGGPGLWGFFLQGAIGFSIVGCILAFWLARSVSRPLRRLRGEVLEIAGGSLERRVETTGPDEVRDVALAVNHMADSLSKYIRNMRELVANISHELRSPLARMQVSMALLEEKLSGSADEKALAQLRLLNEEMEHMNKLIGDTLLSSKLDLHAGPPLTGKVAFSELVSEMLRRHAPLMENRSLSLSADLAEGVELTGDETLLCNLVSNYLDNAAKYGQEGGRVTVRLYTENGLAVFEVENSHAPIAPEVLEKIFEPFYRGGIATGGGVGLGLHLVRQIAEKHRGHVSAENTESGVKFSARLPL